jgi:copper chaperone CopZ
MNSLKETRFKIANMVCEGCAEKISSVLKAVPGVKEVKSKAFQKQILIYHYDDQIKHDELKEVLEKEGYYASEI